MPRILHIFAIVLLIGSVAYSYRIKYHSIALSNDVVRLKKEIEKTRNDIAEAKAEWQVLNNPDRIQKLADAHTPIVGMKVTQIIRWSDLPNRPPPSDPIADKLMMLGEAQSAKHGASAVALGAASSVKSKAAELPPSLAEAVKE